MEDECCLISDDPKHGISFVTALNNKYSCDNEPLSIEIHIPKTAPGRTDCGGLIVPEHLALNYCHISEAGTVADIGDVIASVTELDLSVNLISQWKEVFQIISCFPKLHFLNVSSNPLNLSNDVEWPGKLFIGINQLILNTVKISWKSVWKLLSLMPQVHEMHLSFNEISIIEVSLDQFFPHLNCLYMSGNNISQWDEVNKLGLIFPRLTSLVLLGNPLSEITGENPGANFSLLKSLNLGDTKLSSWVHLEKLTNFQCMTDVRLHRVPFLENYEEKLRRALLVSYLPNVRRLNGSDITATEREDAERAFIRHYMKIENPPPRYIELVAVHGHLDPLIDVDFSATDSVRIRVHYNNRSHLQNFSIHATALDVKKTLAKNLIYQPHQSFNIYHHDVGAPYGHSAMNYLQRSLLNYRVKDGDEFYIEMK